MSELVGRKELADWLCLSYKSSALDRLLNEPDFPKCVRLGPQQPRWFLSEVMGFLKARRDRQLEGETAGRRRSA